MLSMTGFGRGEARDGRQTVSVEIKSLNHRHLEMIFRLPDGLWEWEVPLRRWVRNYLSRGRTEIWVQVRGENPGAPKPVLDLALAKQFLETLNISGKRLGLSGRPELEWLLRMPQVMRVEPGPVSARHTGKLLEQALKQALERLVAMRRQEGRKLVRDLQARLRTTERLARDIRQAAAREEIRRRRDLARRLRRQGLSSLARVAVWPEAVTAWLRADITEELVRLAAHISQCRSLLSGREAAGRKLDFLLQEMNREINTVGSKCASALIAHRVVAVKEELEKIREQVQNLE